MQLTLKIQRENKTVPGPGAHSLKGEKKWLQIIATRYGESSNRGMYKDTEMSKKQRSSEKSQGKLRRGLGS